MILGMGTVNIAELNQLVLYINKSVEAYLSPKLKSMYLVGNFASGKISEARPDINWLLFWLSEPLAEDLWILGNVLTTTINLFEDKFIVRPEFRTFKFYYTSKKAEQEVFVTFNNLIYSPDFAKFRELNALPDYILAGFKSTRKLILGDDILADMAFEVSTEDILTTGLQKIRYHRDLLTKVPLTYHLQLELPIVYNESLAQGKNLMYFGVEMLMTDSELRAYRFLDVFKDEKLITDFYAIRFPEGLQYITELLSAKRNYPVWKYDQDKTKELFLCVFAFADALISKFQSSFKN